jgi:metal-dependent amidase/aminoacylase/carboxypeptidase family protein
MARQRKHARVRRRARDRRALLPAMPAKEIAAFLRSTPVFTGLPAREIDSIASVVDDGLFTRFPKPDVVVGQHVMVGPATAWSGAASPTQANYVAPCHSLRARAQCS